jgi:hypothetical protein
MKKLLLERQPSGAAETQGFLSFPGHILATIEQEWRRDPARSGGESNNSCVPVGTYRLRPHQRPDKDDGTPGDHVVALINEDLGVYYLKEDLPPEGGRYLILLHIANWSHNVVGCIGPGTGKKDSDQGPMVTSSRAAMNEIMDYIDGDDAIIEIRGIV